MDSKKKKLIFLMIVAFATVILIGVGATFAYFSATVSSEENAVTAGAAIFKIELDDDISLIKSNLIPSIEEYVDIASKRVDSDGNFLKPTKNEETGKITNTAGTVCIDDNLNEICSVYTFTIKNPMTDTEVPLYISLEPSVNTFENLYYKVLDKDLNEVIPATELKDDRPYELDENGEKVFEEDSKMSPVVLTNINKPLAKATDESTPSTVTYSIVMWIMETGKDQTDYDSAKSFASTLSVKASSTDGKGITGIIHAAGVDE